MINSELLNNYIKMLAIAMLGAIFAVLLYKVWGLSYRWFIVITVAILMMSISFVFVSWFADFLLMMLMFSIPLAGFVKWLFVGFVDPEQLGNVAYSGAIGIGLIDFLLAGLWMNWLYRIFITRQDPLPKFEALDVWVILLICAYILSIPGTAEPRLGFHAVAHLLKHVLLYFYISRKFRYDHLKWFLCAIVATVALQALLGGYQQQTGKWLGIALDKGAGGEALQYQYSVPGMENKHRATGTAYDSHSLGLMMGMIMPIPLILMFAKGLNRNFRLLAIAVVMLAGIVLVLSFSRSAWLSTAMGISLALVVMFFRWQETQVILGVVIAIFAAIIAAPWVIEPIVERFANAPTEVLTTRFEQWEVAKEVWLHHPFFGYGVGNYMESLKEFNFGMAEELPVHNVFLWILAESGLLGVIAFYGLIAHASLKLWFLAQDRNSIICRLSLAMAIAFFIYCMDGMTDPLFREPVVYIIFWFYVSMSVVLPRLYREKYSTVPKEMDQNIA